MSKIYASAPRTVNAIIAQTNPALFSDRFSSRIGVYVASDAQSVEFGVGEKNGSDDSPRFIEADPSWLVEE